MDPISKADSSQKKIPKQRSMITLDISMVETFNKKKEEEAIFVYLHPNLRGLERP